MNYRKSSHILFTAGFLLWLGAMILTFRGFFEGSILEMNPYMNHILQNIAFPFSFILPMGIFAGGAFLYLSLDKAASLAHTPEDKTKAVKAVEMARMFIAVMVFTIFLIDFSNNVGVEIFRVSFIQEILKSL